MSQDLKPANFFLTKNGPASRLGGAVLWDVRLTVPLRGIVRIPHLDLAKVFEDGGLWNSKNDGRGLNLHERDPLVWKSASVTT